MPVRVFRMAVPFSTSIFTVDPGFPV